MATVATEQAAHIPGPWSVCYDHSDPECRDSIAYIRGPHTEEFDLDAEIAVIYGCRGREDRRAAARVMAAAPDLLRALQTIPQRYMDDMDAHTPGIANMIRAAIAKATGMQS